MKKGSKFTSRSLKETERLTGKLVKILEKRKVIGATVLALSGDLGAGKTTTVQIIGKIFKIKNTITSPTFVILKRYATKHSRFKNLIHVDAYRIEKKEELKPLKIDELFLQKETLIIIEWPENIKSVIPKDALWVSIKTLKDDGREFTIKF